MSLEMLAALYQGFSTEELYRLRHAFIGDRLSAEAAGGDDTRAFCDIRLKVIADVLATRGISTTDPERPRFTLFPTT